MTTLTVLRNEAYLGRVNFCDEVYPGASKTGRDGARGDEELGRDRL